MTRREPYQPGLAGQLAAGLAEGGIGQAAPAGAGARQALLPQHPGRIQALDHDLAVGLGEPGGQVAEVVAADAGDPAVQPGDLPLGLGVAELSLQPGVPVVRVLRTVYDSEGRPVEVQDSVVAADRHEFRYEEQMR